MKREIRAGLRRALETRQSLLLGKLPLRRRRSGIGIASPPQQPVFLPAPLHTLS